jgi:NAD(P)-dependent dehydrogenase (short-subunit alcohol dehydrogenase family)
MLEERVKMSTILITGANKGLGYETARQLVVAGHTVYVGARDVGRGQAAADALGARFVQIDVTDDASVAAAAKVVEADGGLDVLVNNAGIEPRMGDGGFVSVGDASADTMRGVFETNVFGQVRVMRAFLPLLAGSAAPVIVNVSSGLGLARDLADPGNPSSFYPSVEYPASKAAVNMVTVQYAKAFPSIRINAVDPGFTATDLNHHAGTQTVEQGADVIVRMAQVGVDGPTGQLFDASGSVAW